jgi:hypothetical protein
LVPIRVATSVIKQRLSLNCSEHEDHETRHQKQIQLQLIDRLRARCDVRESERRGAEVQFFTASLASVE